VRRFSKQTVLNGIKTILAIKVAIRSCRFNQQRKSHFENPSYFLEDKVYKIIILIATIMVKVKNHHLKAALKSEK